MKQMKTTVDDPRLDAGETQPKRETRILCLSEFESKVPGQMVVE